MDKLLGRELDLAEVEDRIIENFETVFATSRKLAEVATV
jgi:hypothetical protein